MDPSADRPTLRDPPDMPELHVRADAEFGGTGSTPKSSRASRDSGHGKVSLQSGV